MRLTGWPKSRPSKFSQTFRVALLRKINDFWKPEPQALEQ